MSDQRVESLKAAIGQIERQFGKGAVMRLGDDGPREKIESILREEGDIVRFAQEEGGRQGRWRKGEAEVQELC